MTGQPEKVTHGPVQEMFVPQVVNGKASDVVGTYFYVFVDNGEASFADDYGESKPATPVCARTKREAKFRCSVERVRAIVLHCITFNCPQTKSNDA